MMRAHALSVTEKCPDGDPDCRAVHLVLWDKDNRAFAHAAVGPEIATRVVGAIQSGLYRKNAT